MGLQRRHQVCCVLINREVYHTELPTAYLLAGQFTRCPAKIMEMSRYFVRMQKKWHCSFASILNAVTVSQRECIGARISGVPDAIYFRLWCLSKKTIKVGKSVFIFSRLWKQVTTCNPIYTTPAQNFSYSLHILFLLYPPCDPPVV